MRGWAWPSPAGADEIRDDQWHVPYLNLARAHELSQGEGITVAVIDSGVDGNHPDLAGNVVEGVDLAGNSPDGWEDVDRHGTGTGRRHGGPSTAPRQRATSSTGASLAANPIACG